MLRLTLTFAFFAVLIADLPLAAQDRCPLPPSPFSEDRNIFSPAQEMYLGDIMAEQEERDWKVFDDDELNGRLQSVGEALLKHLPESGVKYRFRLIDVPVIDAFGSPGGRIYITRKMVAFLKNDEELAALLAHEVGHIYTHQQAIDFTRLLHEKLAVDSIGNNDDIRRHFNELLDQWRRKPVHFSRSRSAREQIVADQLGLYAMARAGYPPEAMAPFFDRLAETHGNTGGFLSDLFGTTPEDNRRLRDLLRNTAAMPSACIDTSGRISEGSFEDWQKGVIAYSAVVRKPAEFTDALIRKSVLDPPLQDEFRQIRFSPNGLYLLVQDESGITILRRDPLTPVFRIHAPDAKHAGFSPDSSTVVFCTSGLRIERWSIAEKKQASAHEILERKRCLQTALSSDGNTFVCLDAETTLRLFDVSSGNVIFEKKNFVTINWFGVALASLQDRGLQLLRFMSLDFDPSGKIMVAASPTNVVALDIPSRKPISLPASMKERLAFPFTFLTADRMAMASRSRPGIYEFPSGKLISNVPLGAQTMEHAAHGNLVFLRPVQKHAVGLYDLDHQRIVAATNKEAIDAYDDLFASEGKDGKLLLTHWTGTDWQVLASADLPRTELTHLQTVAVSADMNWLAFSLRDRGAVYNLSSHERSMFVRGFRGAQFVSGPALLADYPKKDETPRTVAKLDLQNHTGQTGRALPDDMNAFQVGPFLVLRKPQKAGGYLYSNVTVEVQDVLSGQVIFSQRFPRRVPAMFLDPQSNTMIFAGGVSAGAGENASADEIETQFSWPDEKKSVYEVQVVDLMSGTKVRDIHVDSGKFSFVIRDITATRDYLALTDSENRVQLYSMKTGQQIGIFAGGPAHLSQGGIMSVVAQEGKIDVYECATLKKLKEYDFPSAAIYSHLSDDGERLLVLTADQTVYLLHSHPQTPSGVRGASSN